MPQETFRKWREHVLGFIGYMEEKTDSRCLRHQPSLEAFMMENKSQLPAYLAYLQVCVTAFCLQQHVCAQLGLYLYGVHGFVCE